MYQQLYMTLLLHQKLQDAGGCCAYPSPAFSRSYYQTIYNRCSLPYVAVSHKCPHLRAVITSCCNTFARMYVSVRLSVQSV